MIEGLKVLPNLTEKYFFCILCCIPSFFEYCSQSNHLYAYCCCSG